MSYLFICSRFVLKSTQYWSSLLAVSLSKFGPSFPTHGWLALFTAAVICLMHKLILFDFIEQYVPAVYNVCYAQTLDLDNPWIALPKARIYAWSALCADNPWIGQTLHNLWIVQLCVHVTVDSQLAGHTWLNCAVIDTHTLALSKKKPRKSIKDITSFFCFNNNCYCDYYILTWPYEIVYNHT